MDASMNEIGLANDPPRELRSAAGSLATLLAELLSEKLSPAEAQYQIEREPLLSVLLHTLAGQRLQLDNQAQITFGSGNQFGNVTIGSVAGRDLITVNLTVNQHRPSQMHPDVSALTETCPYPGLKPFDEQSNAGFCGRKSEIVQFTTQLLHQRVLTLVGLSGSGKTSLLRAGLLPALQRSPLNDTGDWYALPILRPGSNLRAALSDLFGGLDHPTQRAESLLATRRGATRLLIVIDAFEELFIQHAEAEIEAADQALATLSAIRICTIVIAMRAEYYHHLLSDLPLCGAYLRSGLMPLPTLGAEGLALAIVEPAVGSGLRIETELVAALLIDCIGDRRAAAILPFLQQTLVLVWQSRSDDLLTVKSYQDLGKVATDDRPARNGLQVALEQRADAALSELLIQSHLQQREQQQLVHRIFLRLLQFATEAATTRRTQPIIALRSDDDPPQLLDEMIERLSGGLLVIEQADDAEQRKVDLIHEALIHAWRPLIEWIGTYREAELLRREWERRAQSWSSGKQDDELLSGSMLTHAIAWQRQYAVALGISSTLRSYLAASNRAERLRQFERLLGPVAAVLLMTLLFFAIVQVYLYNLYRESRALNPVVRIHEGTLTLGPSSTPNQDPFTSKQTSITAYQMDTYEVSNKQFCLCRRAGGCPTDPAYETANVCDPTIADFPVTNVRLRQAREFCQWMGGQVPDEIHWEWAARGPDGRIYAGIEGSRKEIPDSKGVNIGEANGGVPIPVNQLNDLSVSTLIGMTGNVSEWTISWSIPYTDQRYPQLWTDTATAEELVVVRGGNAQSDITGAQTTYRGGLAPGSDNRLVGFRCQYDTTNR